MRSTRSVSSRFSLKDGRNDDMTAVSRRRIHLSLATKAELAAPFHEGEQPIQIGLHVRHPFELEFEDAAVLAGEGFDFSETAFEFAGRLFERRADIRLSFRHAERRAGRMPSLRRSSNRAEAVTR
jgi:hypothetical protein